MGAITEEYIKQVLQKVSSEQGIKNWRFNEEKFESIAQNYFGIIVPIVLTGEIDGKEVQLNLVLKLAPTDKRFRISDAVTFMFAREIFAYSVVLKYYREVQNSFVPELHFVMPRCYYVQGEYHNEAIVMQNMIEDGYRPYTHEMFLDLDHILISLKSLAKLHALSFILEHKNPELYSEILETCIPLTESSGKRYMEVMKDRLDKALKTFEGTEYVQLFQSLKSNCSQIFESVVTSVQKTCLCHGDIWKENVLYKYQVWFSVQFYLYKLMLKNLFV